MATTSNIKYFDVAEHYNEGYIIRIKYSAWPRDISDNGAYAVLVARLFGCSLAELCKHLLAKYQDKIRITGKNCYYPLRVWTDRVAAEEFAEICNAKMNKMMEGRV